MTKTQEIETKLRKQFAPYQLSVVDDSESHRGHGGFREGQSTHFNVLIRSEAFAGRSRIARHRAIHAALGAELIASIHALALDVSD